MTFYEYIHRNTKGLHFEGKDSKGRNIIIDAAEISDGEVEVMVMTYDGQELESVCVSTENAKSVYETLLSKYTQPIAEDVEKSRKPLTGRYKKLAEALKNAVAVGRAVENDNPEDGGACNRDSAMLYLPRWTKALVLEAAKCAGVSCFATHIYGSRFFIVGPDSRAQGNARSRNAEAICEALASMGYDAHMFYALD